MLLRISLVIAILAGAGAFYLVHFPVNEKITTITTERDDSKKQAEEQSAAATKAKAESKKAKEEFDRANKDLEEKTVALEETTKKLAEQQKRANQASESLTAVTKDRNESQQELNKFTAIGLTIDQIKVLRDDLRKSIAERDTFIAENKILLRNLTGVQAELESYTGGQEKKVPLPIGLRGKIVAVDPKYDFVVLDIGGNQGVLENGKLLVNRSGKLVATVRVTRVEANRSIANIIPDLKLAEVMEGDFVIVHNN